MKGDTAAAASAIFQKHFDGELPEARKGCWTTFLRVPLLGDCYG
jgi:hypothetical protein